MKISWRKGNEIKIRRKDLIHLFNEYFISMINLTRIFDAERTAPLVSCSWIELKIVILSTKVAHFGKKRADSREDELE